MNKLVSALVVGFMASGAFVSAPALAQIQPLGAAPPASPQTKGSGKTIAPDAPVPGNPDFKADNSQAQAQVAPPPLPPAMWDVPNALDLLAAINRSGADGLNPADYDPAGLQSAIQSGNPVLISTAATQRFNMLSNDLALGHVRKPARVDWFVVDNDLNAEKQDTLLRAALAQHNVSAALSSLLPTHPQYAALKNALAATSAEDTAKRDRIRLNLDRWRWLPRDLGNKYIIVNVPGFYATLVENGVNRWKQRAIAGKLSTPTPQLNATAVGVMLNPAWNVPKSIEKEAAGKKGFVPIKTPDGKRVLYWQQPPGPTNALGQLKFVMPNSKAIYLHDTNARSRFNDSARALSHGCTIDPAGLRVIVETPQSAAVRVRGATQLPVRLIRELGGYSVTVDVQVPSKVGHLGFEIDTGNGGTILVAKPYAAIFGFDPDKGPRMGSVPIGKGIIASGFVMPAGITLDGNLGMPFLKNYFITIDLKQGRLWLKPNPTPPPAGMGVAPDAPKS